MKVLITGGAGFIGSHLAEHLLSHGCAVTVIDDLSTGSLGNIAHLRRYGDFNFVHDTVTDVAAMSNLVRQCDVIYHLAAAVGVRLIVEQPVRTIKTNVHGTETVLELAREGQKKVLIASTSEVYGKSEAVPFHEDDDSVLGSTMFPRWSYACSKAIDEFLALAYYRQYGLPAVIVRLFNTIGPRQTGQYGMVVPRFIEKAMAGVPIEIYGDGRQTRCFCYVGDVVKSLTALMDVPNAGGQVFNIGSNEEVTIEQLADKIIALTNSSSVKKFISYEQAYGQPFDDMLRRVPSLERLKSIIGFVPETTLTQTLQRIIAAVAS
jgi:UDP-glucose 4-epimerase